MTEPTKFLDLSFIERDVRNQLVHSRDIVAQIEALQSIAANTTDPQAKAQIEAAINALLGIASGLTSNALSTSSSVGTVIGPMFEPGKR